MTKKTKNRIEWVAPEFEHREKNQSWFIVAALIAFGLILWAALTKNFLLIILIVLGFFVIAAFALKKPEIINFSISPSGITINKIFYSFDNLKSFWIFYEPPELKELSLRSKKSLMPYIKIPLGEQNPVEIRQALTKYLPERKQEESLIDIFTRSLRF